jgi:hypothetical protein
MTRDHWKDRSKPTLEHITELFGNAALGAFITGHLLVEAVLVQLIELKMVTSDEFDPFSLSFASKVSVAKSRGLVDEKMAQFLLELNRIRNRLAHRLGEPFTFDSMFALAKCAAAAGIEFTDDTIHLDKEKSEEWYGVEGVIQEIFQNGAQDLSFIMEEHGGQFQFA